MNETMRRVADAIKAFEASWLLDTGSVNSSGEMYRMGKARAAIEALREPSDRMKAAGAYRIEMAERDAGQPSMTTRAGSVWGSMLDAAVAVAERE